jgi:hypothetical protein
LDVDPHLDDHSPLSHSLPLIGQLFDLSFDECQLQYPFLSPPLC